MNFLPPQKCITDREQFAYEFDILREFYYQCDKCGLYLPDIKKLEMNNLILIIMELLLMTENGCLKIFMI